MSRRRPHYAKRARRPQRRARPHLYGVFCDCCGDPLKAHEAHWLTCLNAKRPDIAICDDCDQPGCNGRCPTE